MKILTLAVGHTILWADRVKDGEMERGRALSVSQMQRQCGLGASGSCLRNSSVIVDFPCDHHHPRSVSPNKPLLP